MPRHGIIYTRTLYLKKNAAAQRVGFNSFLAENIHSAFLYEKTGNKNICTAPVYVAVRARIIHKLRYRRQIYRRFNGIREKIITRVSWNREVKVLSSRRDN